eukprot:GHVH01005345.1.p1 GENE.GHVH01005345.1~~GHVH01005345.1.p1  ORF type:complete len:631 (+),score=78.61 GHVH01005345.1:1069-2961(+)
MFSTISKLNHHFPASNLIIERSKYRHHSSRKSKGHPHNLRSITAGFGVLIGFTAVYCSIGDSLVLEASLDSKEKNTIRDLKSVCQSVIVSKGRAKPYTTGQRIGKCHALAVCRPKTLREAVDTLQTCVDNDVAVITQGANTGLTGGSVPRENIDRPVVIINMRALQKITHVGKGCDTKMLCLPGTGILSLSKAAETIGRESHSVLGSLFLNPTVAAGIAFGSGGTQVRKGPAYTERVLYAKVNADGKVDIVNETGIKANSIDELFQKIESGSVSEEDIDFQQKPKFWCDHYPTHVTKIDAEVSRFNSFSGSPCDASRCEGKVMILASLHQTFPRARGKEVYWVSSNNFDAISNLRTKVVLSDPTGKSLPASCEYMNKDTIDITVSHGSTACAAILFGGMERLALMYRLQSSVDKILPLGFSDRVMNMVGKAVPRRFILPKPVLPQLNLSHHVLLDMSDFGNGELECLKGRFNEYLEEAGDEVVVIHLSKEEIVKANIFRFTNAAAFKIFCLLKRRPGLSLDYALRKNDTSGFPVVPSATHKRMLYGHLGCNVIHDDIVFDHGVDPHVIKYRIKEIIESQGGILPAEHGHGTEYAGTKEFQKKLMRTDPLNIMNPGIAGTSPLRDYAGITR